MIIHRDNIGFTFTLADAGVTRFAPNGNAYPLVADVAVHFDDGPLVGLQVGGLAIITRPDLDEQDGLGASFEQFVPGTSGLTATVGGTIEPFCELAFSAFDEFRALSAADPTAA